MTSGSKRRKVTRTIINSKGEEVTEEVWEEEGQPASDDIPDRPSSQRGSFSSRNFLWSFYLSVGDNHATMVLAGEEVFGPTLT